MKRRTAARLAAIQALYGRDIAGDSKEPASQVLDIIAAYENKDMGEEEYERPDEKLLLLLVTGVTQTVDKLDSYITPHLSQGWNMEKLGALMRAVLRASIYELIAAKETPPKVIISEYVSIARAFFTETETGFVNGIVDKIAKEVRS